MHAVPCFPSASARAHALAPAATLVASATISARSVGSVAVAVYRCFRSPWLRNGFCDHLWRCH
eukprot:12145785-Alexandrium_andersonii.AAC.1